MSRIKDFYNFEQEWTAIDVRLPKASGNGNSIAPQWIHFGGGNLYRGFHAKIAQDLLNQGSLKSGIVVGETFDEEVIYQGYQQFDNNFMQVIMHEDGRLDKNLLSSTAESFFVQSGSTEYQQFSEYFTNENLQLVTLTITEKGYNIVDTQNKLLPIIEKDISEGPAHAQHTMSIMTALLLKRFESGGAPLAMVSTDNFSRNGEKFQNSIKVIAQRWIDNNFAPSTFLDYLSDEKLVSFPWTMIDRITPNPSEEVASELQNLGIEDARMIKTSKGTNIASFVNTEVVHYLVLEDSFPNGRPPLENAGVIMTDRITVEKADAMKVTTCLNPLHTALAIFGSLLGYKSIAEEMKNKEIVSLIKGIGYTEGIPVVDDPQIINPTEFINQVVTERLPNVMIPDTPQRIAADTSQKLAIRYGETIMKYVERPNLEVTDLQFIPFTIAGWLRYLIGIDDNGRPFEPSPDPLLAELMEQLSELSFNTEIETIHEAVAGILSNTQIFGLDLYQAGLGEKIELFLFKLLRGTGSIERELHTLNEEFAKK